jgi:subtilase family serine protease
MHSRTFTAGAGSLLACVAIAALAACSNGSQSPAIPQTQNAAAQTATTAKKIAYTSRFLPSAHHKGVRDSSNIIYQANPPLSKTAVSPAAFPPPSFCVAHFGLACYTPSLIRTGYNVPSGLDGTGQTIVIVDAYGSPTVKSDLHTFDVAMGLPDPVLKIYYPTGQPPAFAPHDGKQAGWANETSLDTQWAHAIAPGANIALVIASSNYGNVLNTAVRFAIDNHLGNVISLSYGSPEAAIAGLGNNTQLLQADANFQAAEKAGMTVLASSGDYGATNNGTVANALFPASDPLVTAVGGTNLFLSDTGAYEGETVWNDADDCPFGCHDGIFGATGGAPSKIFAAPSYQAALSGLSARTTSDVAYNASVYTGVLVHLGYLGANSGFYFFGGTSEGAPQWAGLVALADEAAGHSLGLINPKLYAIGANASEYAADFHDVTTGDNVWNGAGFSAKTGYDLPTGLGSPNAANLINDLSH